MARGDRLRTAAQPQPGDAAERDGADLSGGRGAEQNDQGCGDGDGRALAIRGERARHAPNRLRYDGNGDELEAVQQPRARRSTQRVGAIGEQDERDRRRQREAGPGRERAGIARPHQADGKSGLARSRPGQELAQCDDIDIGLFVEPFAARDELLAEVAEMRDRAAEAREPEP